MSVDGTAGDHIELKIDGLVSGQVAVGRDNHLTIHEGAARSPDIDALRTLVDRVRAQIAADAPPDQRDAAVARVDELQDAVTAPEPDLDRVHYVLTWFRKHLPKLAGSIVGLVVHPVLGRVVEAAGDLAAAEFQQLFGDEPRA